MYQQHITHAGWLRFNQIAVDERPFVNQSLANQLKLANGKNVIGADISVITRCVKDVHAG